MAASRRKSSQPPLRIAVDTGGTGVDHVVEVGGPGTTDESIRATKPGGTVSLVGVLTGLGARIDPLSSGLGTSAYITMTVRQHAWRDLREQLAAIGEIEHMALVGGEFDGP